MHCNVMNYYEILFLIIIGVVVQSNCLGCYYPGAIFRVAIIWGYISAVNYSAGQ